MGNELRASERRGYTDRQKGKKGCQPGNLADRECSISNKFHLRGYSPSFFSALYLEGSKIGEVFPGGS
jgi:hypothetical protein